MPVDKNSFVWEVLIVMDLPLVSNVGCHFLQDLKSFK
jgi:hypothetical protein